MLEQVAGAPSQTEAVLIGRCSICMGAAQLQCCHLQVLRASKGAMQLLDMSSRLPSLKRLPGMKKWYGRDKLRYYASWAEAMQVSPQIRGQQSASLVLAVHKLLKLLSALYV